MEQEPKRLDLKQLVPADWPSLSPDGSIWLTLYRAHGVDLEQFPQVLEVVELKSMGVKVVCVFGELEYPDVSQASCEFDSYGEPKLDISKTNRKCKSNGLHLAFMTPFSAPASSLQKRLEQEHVSAAVALFAAFCGRLIVFYHLADLRFFSDSGNMVVHFKGFDHPGWNQSPDLSDGRFESIRLAATNFGQLDNSEKNKIHLSLRWLGMAHASTGVDAVLKYWISLETLAMKDTNIRPINEILAKCYNMTFQQAVTRFKIGRLQGLRGDIVHKGKTKGIDSSVTKYLEAVCTDVLFYRLGVPCEKRAEALLQSTRFDFS